VNWLNRLKNRPAMIKLFHWEYWSFGAIYSPIYLVWIVLCVRARSLFFFSASNPSILNGGFLNESKKDLAKLIPADLQPKAVFFSSPVSADQVMKSLRANGLDFPLIGKPDIGGRGRGVKTLLTEQDVNDYVQKAALDFHIQEYVPYPKEVGIFYFRYPDDATGQLSGIVRKEFLKVKGDGISKVQELLLKDKRAILQLDNIKKNSRSLMDLVLPHGEELILVPYGNHARGAEFLDDSHLISPELTRTIDEICQRIPNFFFGRLDIRYDNWEDLTMGRNFSVIEVNGAGSEPTHIYDPKHSLFFAWKEIIRHWIILWRISRINHRKGFAYLSFKQGLQMFREDKINSEKLRAMKE
jgi:hypothetical protein